jgi:hypothetical protein
MPTPAQAMMWELWRLSRWEILYRTLGPAALWGSVFCLLGTQANAVEASLLTIPVFMLTVMTSMFSGLWMNSFENSGNGFTFHLGFTRPVSTAMLVAGPMAYISCAAAVCYLAPSAFLRALFGLPLPLFPVAAVIATACAVFIMSVWSAQSRMARLLNFMAVMFGFQAVLYFGVGLSPEVFISPDTLLEEFSLSIWGYMILLALFVGSIAVTTLAVDRQRHGERWSSGRLNVERADLSGGLLRWNGPFSTPRQAQYWYEMRRSGAPLLMFGLAVAVSAFLGIVVMNAKGDLASKAVPLWGAVLAGSLFVFLLMGAEWLLGLRRKQGAVSLSTFDATQPMGNGGLIAIKLIVLTTCVLLSGLFMAAAAAVWTMLWGDHHQITQAVLFIRPVLARVSLPSWACIGLVLIVNYAAASAMLIAGGLFAPLHPKLMGTLFGVGLIYFLLSVWDAKHGWMLKPFWEAHAWIIAAALAAATFLSWRKALHEGYLRRSHLFTWLCIWLAYTCAAVALCLRVVPTDVSIPSSVAALGLSSLSLPLVAIAVAPLVLAAHRHR